MSSTEEDAFSQLDVDDFCNKKIKAINYFQAGEEEDLFEVEKFDPFEARIKKLRMSLLWLI